MSQKDALKKAARTTSLTNQASSSELVRAFGPTRATRYRAAMDSDKQWVRRHFPWAGSFFPSVKKMTGFFSSALCWWLLKVLLCSLFTSSKGWKSLFSDHLREF